jgi:hypothetical protein
MNIIVVPADQIEFHWPEIAKLLQPVIDVSFGEVTLEGIYNRLMDGQEILIGVFDSTKLVCACVLGITQFETGKRVLQMPYVGGNGMEEWLVDGFDLIRQIAASTGCSHIRGCGREGWGRVLPDLKRIRSIYECEV